MPLLAVETGLTSAEFFAQCCLNGLTFGALIALIALGYTMVYGIIGLINFAHGDLFMLSSFLALTLVAQLFGADSALGFVAVSAAMLLVPVVAAGLNVGVDQLVYRPLRTAPKLAPLVSAIGVSFIFMNLGQLWMGAADINFPSPFPARNLAADLGFPQLNFRWEDLMVFAVTIPLMLILTYFVRYTTLGKAMRSVEQNQMAAQLMGVNVNHVIVTTFAIGGALAGAASVIYGLQVHTVSYQMGFQNGLFAFTAAVVGGIGNLPGAVLGGLLIGLIRQIGGGYLGEVWTNAVIFAILIVVLIFRPSGLLGTTASEKV